MVQDLRFAFRLFRQAPWFTSAAIATLALGIGVNAIGFTIVNAAFLRALPFEDARRLHVLSSLTRSGGSAGVSHADFQDWRDQSTSFALAAFGSGSMNISDDQALPEQVRGAWLTANAFRILRQRPLLGRDFAPGDEHPGAELVVIIGEALWKNRYGGDPNVPGRRLRLNGQPATIVGVMPDGMRFPENTELWTPFIPTIAQQRRDARSLSVLGRLRDGAGPGEAATELSGIAQRLAAAYPDTNTDVVGVRVETLTEALVGGPARTMFITVMGAVCFVLLIACTNVANLLLSRSAYRAREIAVRMAVGATRWRVVRQLLIENLVLSLVAGGLGLSVTLAGVRFFDRALQDAGKPYWLTFTVDYVVFGYVAAICVATAVVFGLAPALHVSKSNNNELLKEAGRGAAGNRRVRRFTDAMIAAELAIAIVLLAGGGLMTRSFLTHYTLDTGVRTGQLMTMDVRLPESKYATAEARRTFFDRLERRLAAIPGVQSSAVTTGVPPFDGGERLLEIDRSTEEPRFVSTVTITPAFFEIVGRALVRGRGFDDTDGAPGSETVIINERLASRFFRGEDPIGRRIRFTQRQPRPGQPADLWRTIVGISPSIRHGSPDDAYLNAVVYIPYRQEPAPAASVLLRTALPSSSVADAVRRAVQAVDRDQPVVALQTLEEMMAQDRWPYRAFGGMFALFAVIALVLSCMGLYAVMAYSVTQRTREIGLRMAVGARPGQVSLLILKRGLAQIGVGLTLGLAATLASGRVMGRLLVGIEPSDPVTLAAVTSLLVAVSIAACLLPARRAARIDPLTALRAE